MSSTRADRGDGVMVRAASHRRRLAPPARRHARVARRRRRPSRRRRRRTPRPRTPRTPPRRTTRVKMALRTPRRTPRRTTRKATRRSTARRTPRPRSLRAPSGDPGSGHRAGEARTWRPHGRGSRAVGARSDRGAASLAGRDGRRPPRAASRPFTIRSAGRRRSDATLVWLVWRCLRIAIHYRAARAADALPAAFSQLFVLIERPRAAIAPRRAPPCSHQLATAPASISRRAAPQ